MPVSSTAQRMPVVCASKRRAAASALTVMRDRHTLVLASRLRLMLHTQPAAEASTGCRPSNKSAKPSISCGVGRSPVASGAGRSRRSHSIAPAIRISFSSSRGSAPGTADRCAAPVAPALVATSIKRVARHPLAERRDHPLPPVGERQRAAQQFPERQRREHDRLVEQHARRDRGPDARPSSAPPSADRSSASRGAERRSTRRPRSIRCEASAAPRCGRRASGRTRSRRPAGSESPA